MRNTCYSYKKSSPVNGLSVIEDKHYYEANALIKRLACFHRVRDVVVSILGQINKDMSGICSLMIMLSQLCSISIPFDKKKSIFFKGKRISKFLLFWGGDCIAI